MKKPARNWPGMMKRPATHDGRAPRGTLYRRLELLDRVELEVYGRIHGARWRGDLLADCLRGEGGDDLVDFDRLCRVVRREGATWVATVRVPWERG